MALFRRRPAQDYSVRCVGSAHRQVPETPVDRLSRHAATVSVASPRAEAAVAAQGDPLCQQMCDEAEEALVGAATKNKARVALSRPGFTHTSRPESWSTTTVRYVW